MALPNQKIKKIKLPDGGEYEIIPSRLQGGDGTHEYEAVLPTLTQDSVLALASDIPSGANQKVKAGNVTFGDSDTVNLVGTGIVGVTGNADNDTITISASHQSIKTLNTTATSAQTTSASEAIAGSGTITLHKISKTGSYNDLSNAPVIVLEDNGSTMAGFWLAKTDAITALSAGQIFLYRVVVAGAATTQIDIACSGTASGSKTIYRAGTTKLTTEYGPGSYILFYYNGTAFTLLNDYDANSYHDTTYTFAEGSTNKAFTVTPSGGATQTVSIHGLGDASLKGVSTTVTSGDQNLVTGNAVQAALNALPPDTNQKVKAGSATFGADDVVNFEGGGIVSVTGDATNDKITISASHQSIKALDTTATSAQATNANEAIAGSGKITLHKVSKTGSYDDLNNAPFLGPQIIVLEDNGSTVAGTWLAKTSAITALAEGQIFMYEIVVAGASTTKINITCSGTATGAKTIYRVGSTKLTTQYAVGQHILFYYNGSTFTMINDSDSNTDTKVRQYQAGTAVRTGTQYPILARYVVTDKAGSYDTNYTRYHTDTYVDTATGNIYLPNLYADGTIYVSNGTKEVATKEYVDSAIDDLPEPMVFKGTLGTGGTITQLPTPATGKDGNEGHTYKVITAGTYASKAAKVGDVFTSTGTEWVLIPAGDDVEDTWRAIQVNGTQLLGSGISTGAVNFKQGTSGNLTVVGNGNDITIDAVDTGATSVEVTGSGNVVSDASYDASTRKITFTKDVTALTSHQAIKTLKTNNTTAQTASASESLAGSGTINLHKVAKTGTYSDLIGKPDINNGTLTIQGSGTAASTFTANQSGDTTLNIKGSGGTTVTKSADNEITISTGTIPTVNNGTLTIQKNGTQVTTFSANQSGNATANITVPTKDSDITNDQYVRYDTNAQGLTDTQKTNARTNIGASDFSGSYNDLTDKPTIPTVNNATLTIQKNGTTVKTFTANASSNVTANITVPTKDSDITNDQYVRYDTNSQGLTSAQKTNARTNIGAGTSDLALGTSSTTAAAGDHTYHYWTVNKYYYDSYTGEKNWRIMTENVLGDTLRWQAGTVADKEYWDYDSSSWKTSSLDLTNLFDGNSNSFIAVPYAQRKFRFTMTANAGWPSTALLCLEGTWFNTGTVTPITGTDYYVILTVESRASASADWAVKVTANFAQSYINKLALCTSALHTGDTLYRFTIELAPWTNTTNNASLKRLMVLSNYSGASLTPFTYNGTGKVTAKNTLNATTLQEGGTNLASKYLGISAKAADSDKLDNHDSTYYLNYNNLTNKPTIPTKTSDLTNDSGFLTAETDTLATVLTRGNSASKDVNMSDFDVFNQGVQKQTYNYSASQTPNTQYYWFKITPPTGTGSDRYMIFVESDLNYPRQRGVYILDVANFTSGGSSTYNVSLTNLGSTLHDDKGLVNCAVDLSGNVYIQVNAVWSGYARFVRIIRHETVSQSQTYESVGKADFGVPNGFTSAKMITDTGCIRILDGAVDPSTAHTGATVLITDKVLEGGSYLSDKYLGKTDKAADADKLDGQDGSYYLDYDNLTDAPQVKRYI